MPRLVKKPSWVWFLTEQFPVFQSTFLSPHLFSLIHLGPLPEKRSHCTLQLGSTTHVSPLKPLCCTSYLELSIIQSCTHPTNMFETSRFKSCQEMQIIVKAGLRNSMYIQSKCISDQHKNISTNQVSLNYYYYTVTNTEKIPSLLNIIPCRTAF